MWQKLFLPWQNRAEIIYKAEIISALAEINSALAE